MSRYGHSGARRWLSAFNGVGMALASVALLGLFACSDGSKSKQEAGASGTEADRDPGMQSGASERADRDGDEDGSAASESGASDAREMAEAADADPMDGEGAPNSESEGNGGADAGTPGAGADADTAPEPAVTGIMGGEAVMTEAGDEVILAEPAEAEAMLATALCEGARRCCREAGQGDSGLVDCESSATPGMDLVQAVGKGFVAVDAAVLPACVQSASTSELDCAERNPELGPFGFLVALPACEGLLYGVVPLGGSCSWDEMCQQGEQPVRCVPDVRLGRVCQAVPRGEAGDPCLLTSSPTADTYVQQQGAGSAECRAEEGLYCGEQADGTYVCTEVKSAGAACGSHMECEVDAYCDGTCKPLIANDQACAASRQCSSQQCDNTLSCTERLAPQGVVCRDPLAQ